MLRRRRRIRDKKEQVVARGKNRLGEWRDRTVKRQRGFEGRPWGLEGLEAAPQEGKEGGEAWAFKWKL